MWKNSNTRPVVMLPNPDPRPAAREDDDTWEVKAFAEDNAGILRATWPPRSYTCTFCGREFKSAQALGGHMNVHRRDRARLRQSPPESNKPPLPSSANASTLIIPPREFVTNNDGLCLLYSLPNPNGVFAASAKVMNSCINTTSTLLSTPSMNLQLTPRSVNSSVCHSSKTKQSAPFIIDNIPDNNFESKEESAIEEIDLELRLGLRSSSTP